VVQIGLQIALAAEVTLFAVSVLLACLEFLSRMSVDSSAINPQPTLVAAEWLGAIGQPKAVLVASVPSRTPSCLEWSDSTGKRRVFLSTKSRVGFKS
jgi:hypothetical protein